jgi:hypothetical protein
MWIDEATKIAAVTTANRGISPSRSLAKPIVPRGMRRISPPIHHGSARTFAEMWTAKGNMIPSILL